MHGTGVALQSSIHCRCCIQGGSEKQFITTSFHSELACERRGVHITTAALYIAVDKDASRSNRGARNCCCFGPTQLACTFLNPWGPLQVAVEPAHDEAYLAWRLETDLRAPYW